MSTSGIDTHQILTIKTEMAPQAIGPYSQGKVFGNLLFTSGQIALDRDGNDFTQSQDSVLQYPCRAASKVWSPLLGAQTVTPNSLEPVTWRHRFESKFTNVPDSRFHIW